MRQAAQCAMRDAQRGETNPADVVDPSSKFGWPPLRYRLAQALVSTALTFSASTVPLRRLDPAPPPAAVLPVGDPTPGIGSCRG
jgi:hypothetical protein